MNRNARKRAPSDRTRRRREGRRNRVLSSAIRLVEERGLDGFTLGDLAQELDYSPAALYRYFPSKDALVAELQRRVVEALDRDLERLIVRCGEWCAEPGAGESVGELLPLVAIAARYDRFAADAPGLFGLLSQGLGHPGRLLDDELAATVIAAAQGCFRRLAGLAADAAAAGALSPGDPMQRAVALWAALQGVVQLRKLRHLLPGPLQPRPLLETVVRSMLEGWGAEPGRIAAALRVVSQQGLAEGTIDPTDEGSPQAETPRHALAD
jgi:AcrR family transcriptional regulator